MFEYRYTLSEKDEGVPEDYIGIYDLFSIEKYALPNVKKGYWVIGNKHLQEMRRKTYQEVKKRFEKCEAVDYARFWNGNIDAINTLGINEFANLLRFKELATAMVCFRTVVKSKEKGKKRWIVSFGIKDSIYREYYKAQREALRTGEEPKPVNLFDSHKKRTGNVFKLPTAALDFATEESGTQMMKIPQNAVYNMFEFWCKASGISRRDALYRAMTLLVKTYPVKGLKEIGAYERKCDLDYVEVIIPEQTAEETVQVKIDVPKSIHNRMRTIIENYNLDAENIGKPSMGLVKYINNAIARLNDNVPLRYSDPEKYKEYMQAKKAEEYNKAILGNK